MAKYHVIVHVPWARPKDETDKGRDEVEDESDFDVSDWTPENDHRLWKLYVRADSENDIDCKFRVVSAYACFSQSDMHNVQSQGWKQIELLLVMKYTSMLCMLCHAIPELRQAYSRQNPDA